MGPCVAVRGYDVTAVVGLDVVDEVKLVFLNQLFYADSQTDPARDFGHFDLPLHMLCLYYT